jgi:hypothetical protein
VVLGLVSLTSTLLWFEPAALVFGIALVFGGLALFGSNRRTVDEIVARIRATEVRRAEVFDGLALQTLGSRGWFGGLHGQRFG